MNKLLLRTFLFTLTLLSIKLNAQPVHIEGELLIQLKEKANIKEVLNTIQLGSDAYIISRAVPTFSIERVVAENLGVYLIQFDPMVLNEKEVLNAFKAHPKIQFAQFNHQIESRNYTPNDLQYATQKTLPLIKAPETWDFIKGGLTATGDTIVVGILEAEGVQIDHNDLKDNIWRNRDEIDGNNKDDDGNGYIDDKNGLNVKKKTDDHIAYFHGTGVAGVIGAKADNTIGVSGISHTVKMMIVTNFSTEADVVEGYNYMLKKRQDYNNSGGKKGAFVVATNASFGISKQKPANTPIWCAVYDQLGKAGIINMGATANENINVDVDGDIPSTCPSDYIIGVTNTNLEDQREAAGYGKINIDLSAPGKGTFTTTIDNKYASFSGTSAATPHVAGAAGLLYSIPSTKWTDTYKKTPEIAALMMKDVLLKGVTPIAELKSITVSGGRLNLYESYKLLIEKYPSISTGLEVYAIIPSIVSSTGAGLKVQFGTTSFIDHEILIFDALGRLMYKEVLKPSNLSLTVHSINVAHLKSGIYFLVMYNKNAKSQVSKFVVN